MKVIIAGSRTVTSYEHVVEAVQHCGFVPTEIVSGGARGVDRLGEQYAKEHGIPCKVFHPDWSQGRTAGFVRNNEMAAYADALIAVWDGASRGTSHMIRTMDSFGKPVFVLSVRL